MGTYAITVERGGYVADQSGLDYLHLGTTRSAADLIKVAYAASQRVAFTATGLFAGGTSSTICNSFTTLVPCGYGPGQSEQQNSFVTSINGTALVGNIAFNLSADAYGYKGIGNYASRSIGGVVIPYRSDDHSFGDNLFGSASVTSKRHTETFYATGSSLGSTTASTYLGVPYALSAPRQYTTNVALTDKVKSNDKLALTHTLSLASATGAGSSLIVGESATWQPALHDFYLGAVYLGQSQPSYAGVQSVSDPLAAAYDCYNGSIFGSGPVDAAVPESQTYYDFSWLHTFKAGNVKAELWHQNMLGQQLYAAVPIAADPSSIFPGGFSAYLGALQGVWSSPDVCGTIPFSSNHIYLTQSIAGVGEVGQGATLSGTIPLGKNLTAFPVYTASSIDLTAIDPRLAAPDSYYAIGEQLPHRPLITAGLTLDLKVPRANVEWAVNAQYTGNNNPNNLPAYLLYNTGLALNTPSGTFTLVESNMFGTDSGLFETYRGVNPMPVVGGGTFALATTPAYPRQWSFTWRVPWHQHISPPPKKTTIAPSR